MSVKENNIDYKDAIEIVKDFQNPDDKVGYEALGLAIKALEKQKQMEEAEVKDIIKKLDGKKEQLVVKDLKEFISELPDNMKIYIVSDDDMPVRKLVDISSETEHCYSELYLDTIEC